MTVNRASIQTRYGGRSDDSKLWELTGTWKYFEQSVWYGLADGASCSRSINFTNAISPLTFIARASSGVYAFSIEMYIDEELKQTWVVPGNETLTTFSYDVSALTGYHTLKFVIVGGSNAAAFGSIDLQGYEAPIIDFSAAFSMSPVLYRTTFTDKSTEIPTSWAWDFGDGKTSTVQNPVHDYSNGGAYSVKLSASNAYGTTEKTISIKVPAPPIVEFSATPREGLTVDFEDLSENMPTGWAWDFGEDPTKIKNTAHTYAVPGAYNVKLTATNADGTGTVTKNIAVTVAEPATPIPVAAFTSSVPVASSPLALSFKDQSTNTPTSWAWDFGDGKTSDQKNPSHMYSMAGTYLVKLTATNEYGTAETTKAIVVTAPVISWSVSPEKVPVNTTARITLNASGFKSGSKIRVTQPTYNGIVSKIVSISSTQIVFEFLFNELFTGICGISVIPTSGSVKMFDSAITVE